MSAERLREAAKVLRERAEEPASGASVWYAERTERDVVTVFTEDDEAVFEDPHANLRDARYIATMHPSVGLALADWLEWTSVLAENDGTLGSVTLEKAMAVADLILGGTP